MRMDDLDARAWPTAQARRQQTCTICGKRILEPTPGQKRHRACVLTRRAGRCRDFEDLPAAEIERIIAAAEAVQRANWRRR